jgi:hypothetical protein
VTFVQLQTRLAERRNGTLSVTATATRYKNALNEAHRALLRKPGMERMRSTTTTKASVAGTQAYTVTSCAKIVRIWETTNDIALEMRPLSWLRHADPDPQQATPTVWIPTAVTGTTQGFLLWPTPSAVITYTLDILSAITDLSGDSDVPLLPDDFHTLLIDMAELEETKKADDPNRYAMLQGRIKDGQADLRSWLAAHPDWFALTDQTEAGFSRLGAYFPAGT